MTRKISETAFKHDLWIVFSSQRRISLFIFLTSGSFPSSKDHDLYKWNYVKHKQFGDRQSHTKKRNFEWNICQISHYDVYKRLDSAYWFFPHFVPFNFIFVRKLPKPWKMKAEKNEPTSVKLRKKSVNKKFIDASEECLPKHRARSTSSFSYPSRFSIVANKPWVFQISSTKSNQQRNGERLFLWHLWSESLSRSH